MEEGQEVTSEVIDEVVTNEEVTQDALQNENEEAAQEVKKPEPLPHGVQKRIDRAVRQKYEAEARANVLEERIRNIENQQRTQPRQQEQGAPKLDQFDNIEDYVAAKAEYVADKLINEKLSAREKAEQERNAQAAQGKTAESWQKRISSITAELPDYDDVVGSSDVVFRNPVVLDAIKESDLGPQVAYYLASNPDEADEIDSLSGIAAVRAIGRLEAKLVKQGASTTRTPAPIKTVGQKSNVVKSPEKMSDAEFAKWRKSQIAQRN